MKRLAIALLAVATAAAITPSAFADSITLVTGVGTSIPTAVAPGTISSLSEYSTSGTALTTTGPLSVSATGASGTFTADYSESVYEGGSLALCPTCINFAITLSNTASSDDDIEQISLGDFGSATVDAAEEGANTDPYAGVYETSYDTVDSFLNTGLAPGRTAEELILLTNSTSYSGGTISFQDSGTATVSGFAITPEPSSLLLLGTGLFGLAFLVFRKRVKPSIHPALTEA